MLRVRVRRHGHRLRREPRRSAISCALRVRRRHMLVQRPDGEAWRLLDAVEAEWRLRSLGGGGVVAVLEVGACFVHRGKAGAEKRGGLRRLSRGLFLGGSLEEFLKSSVVLPGLGQQGWGVLLGKQARLGHGTVSDSHERFSTQVRACCWWSKRSRRVPLCDCCSGGGRPAAACLSQPGVSERQVHVEPNSTPLPTNGRNRRHGSPKINPEPSG